MFWRYFFVEKIWLTRLKQLGYDKVIIDGISVMIKVVLILKTISNMEVSHGTVNRT